LSVKQLLYFWTPQVTKGRPEDRPLILGLTASVLNDKGISAAQNRAKLADLEKTFHAAVVGPREAMDSLQ
jgi:hypothetical protein